MKNWSKIIALVLVVAVLAVAFVLLKNGSVPQTGAQASSTPTSNPESVHIFDFKKDNIAKIELKRDAGDIVLTQADKQVQTQTQNSDGTTSATTQTVKVWASDSFNVDSSKVDGMALVVDTATTSRLIEADPKDLTIYGLDKPVVTTFYTTDGKTESLQVGNKTPTGTAYYILRNGDKAVYTLDAYYAQKFTVGKLDLMSTDLYTRTDLQPTEMTELSFYKGDQEFFSAHGTTENDWRLTFPLDIGADPTDLGKFVVGLTGLRASQIVELDPADLKLYGLDKPQFTFKYTLGGQNYVLKVGSLKDSAYYAMMDGSNYVFAIDSSSLDFTGMPFSDLVEKLVYLPSIYDTSKLIIQIDGRTDTLEMNLHQFGDTSAADTTASPAPSPEPDVYIFNGKKIEGDNLQSLFRQYYQGAIGVMGDRVDIAAQPQGTPFATFTYTNKADGKVSVVKLLTTPDDYGYYIMKDDKYSGLVMRKGWLDDKSMGIRPFYNSFINALNGQK